MRKETRQVLSIEQRSIDFIPESERHGKASSGFTLWFGANMQVTAVATGALGVTLGLSLPWAIVALAVGNLFGGLFMALHSAQGPKLGIPQMIQSRAQFGYVGAIVPLLLVVLMYIGFFASSAILGGSALATWWGIGTTPATIIVAAVCTILAVYGYRLIHTYERWVSLVSGVGFAYLTVKLVTAHGIGHVWHAGAFHPGTFLLVIAIAATWQITYAPYVADYSRYLPSTTRTSAAFLWTYCGSVIASVWMMIFGSIAVSVAAKAFNQGNVSFITGLGPRGTSWLFSLVIILGIVAANPLNLYGTFMSSTTTISALARFRMRPVVRLAFIVTAAVIATGVAVIGQSNFLTNFSNFILFLSYFLVPWTAINLADFYLVRHERYDIDAIFDPDGIYGRVDWGTLAAYLIGIGVELPFMNTSFYVGPVVNSLGGADISWMIGLVVAGTLYYVFHRSAAQRSGTAAALAVPGADRRVAP
jgi:nucleobase:cation symporter-1, NCS1 family